MNDSAKRIFVHYTDQTVALEYTEINAEQVTGNIAPYLPAKGASFDSQVTGGVLTLVTITTIAIIATLGYWAY